MTRRSVLRTVVVLGLAIALAAIGAAAWLATSETAFEWAAIEAVKRSNGALTIEGARGRLTGPLALERLTYDDPDVRVTLERVSSAGSVLGLVRGRLSLATLDADAVTVVIKPSPTPAKPPATLALPIEVSIDRVAIRRLAVDTLALTDLRFAYAGGASGHELRALSVTSELGPLTGTARIGGDAPFPIGGELALAREDGIAARFALSGDLLAFKLAANATAKGARAHGTAELAPFAARWLDALVLHGEDVDLAAFDPTLPATRLEIDLDARAAASGWPAGQVAIRNALTGTLSAGRVPLASLRAGFATMPEAVDLTDLRADLGGQGTARGTARVGRDATRLDLAVDALNLRSLHAPLRATNLAGTLHAELTGTDQRLQARIAERGVSFTLDASRHGDRLALTTLRVAAGPGELRGQGELSLAGGKRFTGTATLARIDPSRFGDYPSASINGTVKLAGALEPDWRADVALTLADSVFRGVRIGGEARADVSARGARELHVALAAGANTLRANGSFGRTGDALRLALDARRLAELDPRLAGVLSANGRLAGEFKAPMFTLEVTGRSLAWQKGIPIAALQARIEGTAAQHAATVQATGEGYDIKSRIDGGWQEQRGWSGTLASFQNAGAYPIALAAPMPLAFGGGRLVAGPGELRFGDGRLSLAEITWEDGRIDTRGELARLPIAPLLALAGVPVSPRTDLRVGGRWDVRAAPRLNGVIELARESGDVVLPGDRPVALQLDTLKVDARFVEDVLDAAMAAHAQTGSARATVTVGGLTRDAPLKLDAQFALESLRLVDAAVGTSAVITGRATATLAGTGTVGAPQLTGMIAAEGLGVDAPQYGVRLRDGVLRAELTDSALTLQELAIRGDEGRLIASGSMPRSGGETRLEWRAEHLRLLNRPDMRLKVDGAGTIALAAGKMAVRGALTADEGYFEFDKPAGARPADDVVVKGRPRPAVGPRGPAQFQSARLDLDMALDFGDRLRIVGAGLDTELRGKIRVESTKDGTLAAHGTVSSTKGVYYAFGQRLAIEKGELIFDGPLDNPALDIVAWRRNIQVEAGVEVTGTVRVPRVRLVSQPVVSDSEKLAWLTLGRGLQDATGADLALLQAAAAALVSGGNALPLSRRIAESVGLDDIALRGGGTVGGQVVALGKRVSDRLYVEYQQGLSATSTVLRLSYSLTRWVSLRAETGFSSGFGIYYGRSFD